jgi:hypothetical protein
MPIDRLKSLLKFGGFTFRACGGAASAFSSAPSSRASEVSQSHTRVTMTADSDPQVLL